MRRPAELDDPERVSNSYKLPRKAVRPVPWLALAFAAMMGFIFLVGLWTVSQW